VGHLPLIVSRPEERPTDSSVVPTRGEGVTPRKCNLNPIRARALIDSGLLALLTGAGHGVFFLSARLLTPRA
jgi:hypothetical protein